VQVPLTVRHRLAFKPGKCATCGVESTMILRAEVYIDRVFDSTPDVCLDCLSTREHVEETLVFEPVVYNEGVRAPTRSMQRMSRRRETKGADRMGMRKQPASGSLPHAKGDMRRVGEWLGDDKTCRTTKKGFRLTRQFVATMRSWCKRGEKFFITIGFLHPITQRVEDEVVVIDRHVFEERIRQC
jgi:hypothetical protein